MEGRSAVWLLAALLLEALISAGDQNSLKYLEVDKKLVLRPEPVSDPITSITWKFNDSIVGEWVTKTLPLDFYPPFKDRANMDTTTGVLEINNMMKTDSGVYKVEINDKIQSGGYDVSVITQVPEPQAVIGPLTCSQSMKSCSLSCRGDVTEAGPVTFYFKKGDGDWEEGKQNIDIKNDKDTQAVKTFSCRMKNPLGQKDSEPVENKFFVESNGGSTAGIVSGVLFVIAVCVGAAVFYLKKRKGDKTSYTPASPDEKEDTQGGTPLNDVQSQNAAKPEEPHCAMQSETGSKQEGESDDVLQRRTEDEAKEQPANDMNSDAKEIA